MKRVAGRAAAAAVGQGSQQQVLACTPASRLGHASQDALLSPEEAGAAAAQAVKGATTAALSAAAVRREQAAAAAAREQAFPSLAAAAAPQRGPSAPRAASPPPRRRPPAAASSVGQAAFSDDDEPAAPGDAAAPAAERGTGGQAAASAGPRTNALPIGSAVGSGGSATASAAGSAGAAELSSSQRSAGGLLGGSPADGGGGAPAGDFWFYQSEGAAAARLDDAGGLVGSCWAEGARARLRPRALLAGLLPLARADPSPLPRPSSPPADGQWLFLCPLNLRMLLAHFGSYPACPRALAAKVSAPACRQRVPGCVRAGCRPRCPAHRLGHPSQPVFWVLMLAQALSPLLPSPEHAFLCSPSTRCWSWRWWCRTRPAGGACGCWATCRSPPRSNCARSTSAVRFPGQSSRSACCARCLQPRLCARSHAAGVPPRRGRH